MSYLFDAISSLLTCCFPDPSIKLNHRSFKILRLLGEGGFSYVYLVTDSSGSLYALKKIRCPFGQESVRNALKEVEAYNLFNHKSIIKCIDHATIQERDGSKTVYILLPYFRRGNLQDAINANLVNHTSFPEPDLLKLFRGVCVALEQLHEHKLTGVPARMTGGSGPQMRQEEEEGLMEEERQERLAVESGEADVGEIVPYAHRDIKPGNIMIADDGINPVLMDFGSLVRARIPISTRSEAISQQDLAAEQSTMPYRAPELFDVKTGSTLTEKVDIWSLGCTLFALLYGHSPFEPPSDQLVGDSIALAVTQGSYKFPTTAGHGGPGYKEWGAKEVVRRCLVVEPTLRPTIREVRSLVEEIISRMEREGEA